MTQRLHSVSGGQLDDPAATGFRNAGEIHMIGVAPMHAAAQDASKYEVRRTAGHAKIRSFPARLHQMPNAGTEASSAEAHG